MTGSNTSATLCALRAKRSGSPSSDGSQATIRKSFHGFLEDSLFMACSEKPRKATFQTFVAVNNNRVRYREDEGDVKMQRNACQCCCGDECPCGCPDSAECPCCAEQTHR
jgi:4-aminobutyrate aminotransferase-like enzyme